MGPLIYGGYRQLLVSATIAWVGSVKSPMALCDQCSDSEGSAPEDSGKSVKPN